MDSWACWRLGLAGRMMPTTPSSASSMIFSTRAYIGGIATLRTGPGVSGTEASGGLDIDLPLVVHGQNVEPSFWITGTSTPGIPGVPLAWRCSYRLSQRPLRHLRLVVAGAGGIHTNLGLRSSHRYQGNDRALRLHAQTRSPGHSPARFRNFRSWDIIADEQGSLTRSSDWQTAEIELRPLGVLFSVWRPVRNQYSAISRRADRFVRHLSRRQHSPGRYWYTRGEVNFSTSRGRPFNLDALYSWGDFYTGTNQELSFDAHWRFGGHLIPRRRPDSRRSPVAGGRFQRDPDGRTGPSTHSIPALTSCSLCSTTTRTSGSTFNCVSTGSRRSATILRGLDLRLHHRSGSRASLPR